MPNFICLLIRLEVYGDGCLKKGIMSVLLSSYLGEENDTESEDLQSSEEWDVNENGDAGDLWRMSDEEEEREEEDCDEDDCGETASKRKAKENSASDNIKESYGKGFASKKNEKNIRKRCIKEMNEEMLCQLGLAARKKSEILVGRFGTNICDQLCKRQYKVGKFTGFGHKERVCITSGFVPNTGLGIMSRYHHRAFTGIFSDDGQYFMAGVQDLTLRLYDTTCIGRGIKASVTDHEGANSSFPLLQVVQARDVGWAVLDTAYSPNKEWAIYSSWSNYIHLIRLHYDESSLPSQYRRTSLREMLAEHRRISRGDNVLDSFGSQDDSHIPLDLRPRSHNFSAFSIKFSKDSSEILAGCVDDSIYIYSLGARKRVLKIPGHDDDVNAVAFGDDHNSNLIYSGSDDKLIKVWDRRLLNERSPKPVGVLVGHHEGITYIDSKGDGRFLISNSKDQSIKLWDIRWMRNGKETPHRTPHTGWDYRRSAYRPGSGAKALKEDTSLMTFKGHAVLQTLVRCRFSPASTGQRYIVSGSNDGGVYVYDILTGKLASRFFPHSANCRDISWHPDENFIFSTSWDGTVSMNGYVPKL
eukprot:Nk52_evm143s226 gene=Nk52_evmTU143s226